jgi:type I restriction enzyme, S subunit
VKTGWTSKPIGDVFKVVNGGTPKTGTASNWDGPHLWITPAEMGNLETPFIAESRRTLTDEGLRTGAELVPAGSIILSSRAPIGHLVINKIPMAFNQGCKGLIPPLTKEIAGDDPSRDTYMVQRPGSLATGRYREDLCQPRVDDG